MTTTTTTTNSDMAVLWRQFASHRRGLGRRGSLSGRDFWVRWMSGTPGGGEACVWENGLGWMALEPRHLPGVMTGSGDGNKEGCVLPFKYLSIVSGVREQDCLVASAQPGALQTQFLA